MWSTRADRGSGVVPTEIRLPGGSPQRGVLFRAGSDREGAAAALGGEDGEGTAAALEGEDREGAAAAITPSSTWTAVAGVYGSGAGSRHRDRYRAPCAMNDYGWHRPERRSRPARVGNSVLGDASVAKYSTESCMSGNDVMLPTADQLFTSGPAGRARSHDGWPVEASNCDVHRLLHDQAERVSVAFKDGRYSPCAAGSSRPICWPPVSSWCSRLSPRNVSTSPEKVLVSWRGWVS